MKIVITHCLSDSNKGVLAVLMATIRRIRAARPDARITLQSMYSEAHENFAHHCRFMRAENVGVEEGLLPTPYVSDSAAGLKDDVKAAWRLVYNLSVAYLLPVLPAWLRPIFGRQAAAFETLKSADLILMKGGHDICNDRGGLRGKLYVWRIVKNLSLCAATGVPVALLGQSLDDMRSDYERRWVAKTLKRCCKVVVRDVISQTLLKSMGVAGNVVLAPDMAFLTELEEPEGDVLKGVDGKLMGVTAVNWRNTDIDGRSGDEIMEHYVATLAATLTTIHEEYGITPVFMPQDTSVFHNVCDMDVAREVAARLARRNTPSHIVDDDLSPAALAWVYGRCELVIGARFHSCVFAAAAGTPMIAVEYQGAKSRGLMRSLGMEAYVHGIDTIEEEALTRSARDVIRRRDELSHALSAKVSAVRDSLDVAVSDVLEEFGVTKSRYEETVEDRYGPVAGPHSPATLRA